VRCTPLEGFVAARIGAASTGFGRAELERWQLERVRRTVAWAAERSAFYRERLRGLGAGWPASLAQLAELPFTTSDDLREHGERLLCVSQDEVERVVTLRTSGTTAAPKRLWFTRPDQESTLDFFEAGMSTLVGPDDRVLILFPGELPGSVGELLARALERLRATPLLHGPIRDLRATLREAGRSRPTSVVGAPTHVLALHAYAQAVAEGQGPLRLRTALLTADHVPESIVRRLRSFGCEAFEHYGMTEMGLGCAVDCGAHAGYHLRETALYLEIVDPVSGEVLPEGTPGEVVFTTLDRRGMPLLRYRTGDLSRFVPDRCPCGTTLRRLERVCSRVGALAVPCGRQARVTLPALEEVLFALPGLVDFTAAVSRAGRRSRLVVEARGVDGKDGALLLAVERALRSIPEIRDAEREGALQVSASAHSIEERPSMGLGKRAIVELDRG